MITYYLTLSQVFPSTHARAGQPTNFESAFLKFDKKHTIRANYEFWAKRFEKIAKGEAVLSIRQWVGKPYGKGSTQREIALLTREDGIGLQKIQFVNIDIMPLVDGKAQPKHLVANNDGLTYDDWREWFKGYNLSKPMAIIHFTKFRY